MYTQGGEEGGRIAKERGRLMTERVKKHNREE